MEINGALLLENLFLETVQDKLPAGYFFQDFNLKLQLPYRSSMWI